jgi:hypothetical protein
MLHAGLDVRSALLFRITSSAASLISRRACRTVVSGGRPRRTRRGAGRRGTGRIDDHDRLKVLDVDWRGEGLSWASRGVVFCLIQLIHRRQQSR